MTPAQIKAMELIDKYRELLGYEMPAARHEEQFKQCAIIAVEEILATLVKMHPNYGQETYWHPADFWNEVLTELKK